MPRNLKSPKSTGITCHHGGQGGEGGALLCCCWRPRWKGYLLLRICRMESRGKLLMDNSSVFEWPDMKSVHCIMILTATCILFSQLHFICLFYLLLFIFLSQLHFICLLYLISSTLLLCCYVTWYYLIYLFAYNFPFYLFIVFIIIIIGWLLRYGILFRLFVFIYKFPLFHYVLDGPLWINEA